MITIKMTKYNNRFLFPGDDAKKASGTIHIGEEDQGLIE